MLQHEAAAHSGDPEEHPCTALNCAKVFKSATAFEQHFSAAHILTELSVTIDPQYFWCFCTRRFKHFEDIRRHHRDTHQEFIAQHESIFSISTNSSYMCACTQKFDDFDDLLDHHNCVHTSETPSTTTIAINPFPCGHDKCKRSFNSSSALLQHMVSDLYSWGKFCLMSMDLQMDSHKIKSTSVVSNEDDIDCALFASRSAITPSVRSDCSKSPTVLTGDSTPESPSLDTSPVPKSFLPVVQPSQPVQNPMPQNISPSSSITSVSEPVSDSSPRPALTLHPLEQLGHNVDSRNSNHTTMSGVHVNVTVNGPGSEWRMNSLLQLNY